MTTIFIFHGIGGDSQENWFPWLRQKLEEKNYRVIVPDFPNTNRPILDEWLRYMNQYNDEIDENTIFIGHSLGGSFAMRLLEHLKKPISATYLVASISGVAGNQFDPLMTTFNVPPYDWEAIRKNSRKFVVIHSDNDPYIKLSQAEELAKTLDTEVLLVKGAGHFNASAGYTEFPFLLELIAADSGKPLV